jgi:hypothetical protein
MVSIENILSFINKTSLTPPLFIQVPLSSQECLCLRGIDFASFYDFSIGIWKCSDSVVLFAFHFMLESMSFHILF